MRWLRIGIAAVVAAAVTCGLFLFMYFLVSPGGDRGAEREATAGIRFGKVEIPDEIEVRRRHRPDEPPPPSKPPPPPRLQLNRMEQPARMMPQLELPDLDLPLSGGAGLFLGAYQEGGQAAEGDIIPVVVIRPLYPREAAINGIEGWVKLEFTITESGTVKDPEVVDAKPPRVFNREAIRAILKWKFKPRVVDGVAVERRATQVIDFALDDSSG